MGLDVKRPGLKSMWTMTFFGLKYRVRIWKTQQPPPPRFKLFLFVFNIYLALCGFSLLLVVVCLCVSFFNYSILCLIKSWFYQPL